MAATGPQRTFLAGDAVRAGAALSVLAFHVWISTAQRERATFGVVGDVALHLSAGLYVFFVVSGYLVGRPFVRAWLEDRPFPRPGPYLGRRLRRVTPGLWVVLTALLLWFGTFGASAGEVLAMYAFAQNYAPGEAIRLLPQGWTLAIELSFYLVLPLLAVAVGRRRPRSAAARARALWAFLAVVLVGGLWLRSRFGLDNDPQANLATLGWAFVPGLALAAFEVTGGRQLERRGLAGGLLLVAAGAFVALVLLNPAVDAGATNVLDGLVGLGIVGAALASQWRTGGVPRPFDGRVAHALGRWSYGIYLVHVGVGLEVVRHVPAGWGPWPTLAAVAVAVLVVSVALSALLWWLVEEPFIERRLPRLPWQTVRPVTAPPAPPVEERPPAPVA